MDHSDDTARPSNDNADDEALDAAEAEAAADQPPPSAETQLAQTKDQLLRALAEVENTRRRAQREVEDARKYSVANFARDVLTSPTTYAARSMPCRKMPPPARISKR